MADYVELGKSVFSSSFSKLGGMAWLWIIVAVLGVIGAIGYFAFKVKNKDKQWAIRINVRQEDTLNNQVYLTPITIKARRITLSNGLKMLHLEKPILNKRLMPLLNYYTKPGIYDLILTADNRIFIITGIENIDKERKILKVGVRYPGIDHDFDELDKEYTELNKSDKASGLLDIIKAASIGILAICVLIAVIVGGKYWVDAKKADSAIAESQIEVFDTLKQVSLNNAEFVDALNLLLPKLEEIYGTKNLNRQLQIQEANAS